MRNILRSKGHGKNIGGKADRAGSIKVVTKTEFRGNIKPKVVITKNAVCSNLLGIKYRYGAMSRFCLTGKYVE